MKVEEFIMKLKSLPQQATVVVRGFDDIGFQEADAPVAEVVALRKQYNGDRPRPKYVSVGDEHVDGEPITVVLIDF